MQLSQQNISYRPMTTPSNRSSSRKGEKLAQRLSHILALLHQGSHIDKHELAQLFRVDVRTIERDLGERLDGIAERNETGLWQLIHGVLSTIPSNHLYRYARMTGTEQLLPDASLSYLLQQLETPELNRAIHVQSLPHEDLRSQTTLFAQLKSAVEDNKECNFIYKEKMRQVQPYRLIYRVGIWYLAAVENSKLKNFSIALIDALNVDKHKGFIPKCNHLDYIDNKDDVWFTSQVTEVTLRVAPAISHYFTRRDLLPPAAAPCRS